VIFCGLPLLGPRIFTPHGNYSEYGKNQ
jgi:hypothetical protein